MDNWVRCVDCGRKIHHKKIWDAESGKWRDVDDKDEPHICDTCYHLRLKNAMV